MNAVFCAGIIVSPYNTQACFKFPVGEFEISISCDSSLKGNHSGPLTRVDLRVYKGNDDVTLQYLKTESEGYAPTSELIAHLIERLSKEV
jgi:hypothetical protein